MKIDRFFFQMYLTNDRRESGTFLNKIKISILHYLIHT